MKNLKPASPAPGAPGIPPTWTASSKCGVGTAIERISSVWFTLGSGILTEIFHPRVDRASIRDMGLIVTDGQDFFSEEKADTDSNVSYLAEGVPAYHVVNTQRQGRYRIEKDIVTDPERNVILQRIKFTPLQGKLSDYHVYALLAPHLGDHGNGNTAWVGGLQGRPDAVRAARRGSAGAGLLAGVAAAVGRLRRLFRWLAAACSVLSS